MSTAVCCHPRDRDLEDELATAEGARAEGDWKHALHHWVGALAMDAFSEQALAALRKLHAERGIAKTLEEDPFVGAHVARAYLLADRGDYEEAFTIVAQVDKAMPQLGAVRLLVDWFDRAPLSPDARTWAATRLAGAASVGMGRVRLLPGERAAVLPYAELAAKLVVGETQPPFLAAASGVFRRAGRCDEAIVVVERALGGGEEPALLVPLALAHRAAGRPERAAEIFARVHAITKEPLHLLEKGRALADAKKYEQATAAARRWLELARQEPDREATIFLDWLAGCARGDEAALARDYDWVRRSALFHDAIIAMTDASTSMLADPRVARGSKVKLTLSALESPSARMCVAVHQGSGPDPRAVDYKYGAVPTPDPRLPRGKVTTLLWHEVDGVMVQAAAEPPAAVRELVADVARASTDLFAAWDAAGQRCARVPAQLELLAHAMVFPTDPPEGRPTPTWVYTYQVAAACLVARAETGWRGTRRRQILLDLLRGPQDWTTAAAVLVLGEIAVREPDALPEIRRQLIALGKAIPQGGHCSFGMTLAIVAQKVPFFAPEVAQKLGEDWLREPEPPEPAPPAAPPPAAAPAASAEPPPAKRPWWRIW